MSIPTQGEQRDGQVGEERKGTDELGGAGARVAVGTEVPMGWIRRYEHATDFKVIRFLIGSRILSQTATANEQQFWANRGVYIWTMGFTVYVGLDYLLRPTTVSSASAYGLLKNFSVAFLLKLPLFVAPHLILLAVINALNRGYFRAALVQVLSGTDLREPSKYYAPSAGTEPNAKDPKLAKDHASEPTGPSMWVLDYDHRQLGVVALDTNLDRIPELISPNKRTILIRHLAISPDFRPVGIDYELLAHARSLVFGTSAGADRLAIQLRPALDLHLRKLLSQLGFSPISPPSTHSSPTFDHQPFFRNSTLLRLLGWPHPSHPWPLQTWILDRQNVSSN